MVKIWQAILIAVFCAIIFGVVGYILGELHRKKTAEAQIGSAEDEAVRILNKASSEAETRKREAVLEAKDEIHKMRSDTERELRERRNEVQRQEKE